MKANSCACVSATGAIIQVDAHASSTDLADHPFWPKTSVNTHIAPYTASTRAYLEWIHGRPLDPDNLQALDWYGLGSHSHGLFDD